MIGSRSFLSPREPACGIAADPLSPSELQGSRSPPLSGAREGLTVRSLRSALALLWLIVPVAEAADSRLSAPALALACLGLAAFIGVYSLGMVLPAPGSPRQRLACLALLMGLGVLLTLLGAPTFSMLFIFAGVWAAMVIGRGALPVLLLCTALTGSLSAVAGASAGYCISMTAVTLSVGGMMLTLGRLLAANRELDRARHDLARLAVSDERIRFARDLHDLLGHSLSVIAMKAELTSRLLEADPEQAATHVSDLEQVARQALTNVRQAVSGYYEPVLASELDGAACALEAAGIEVELIRPEQEPPAEIAALLAWTVREGTTNIIRHSGARHCRVEVVMRRLSARAVISDDGCGPRPDCPERLAQERAAGGPLPDRAGELPGPDSHGLGGLRERAERLAGRVEVGVSAEGGFRLSVVVPLPATGLSAARPAVAPRGAMPGAAARAAGAALPAS